jgi:hypothetical protein
MPEPRRDHDRALELAASSIDFTLAPEERGWLADHLEGCPDCRRASEAFRDDARAVERLPDASAPDRVRVRLLAAVHGPPARQPPRLLAPVAAGAIAVALIGVLVIRGNQATPPPVGASATPTVAPTPTQSPAPASMPASPIPSAPSSEPSPSTGGAPAPLRWTEAMVAEANAADEIRGLTVGHGLVLASMARPDGRARLWTTGDGRAWEDAELPAGAFGGRPPFLIMPLAEGFASLAWVDRSGSGNLRRIWISPDGRAWRPVTEPSATLDAFAYGLIAAGTEQYLAGGRTPAGTTLLWRSEDGLSWRRVRLGDVFDNAAIEGLASDGSSFFAFGTRSGEGALWTSDDGDRWTELPAPPRSARIQGLAAMSGGLVVHGSSINAPFDFNDAWWSPDGAQWTVAAMPPLPASPADRILRMVRTADGLLAVWQIEPGARVRAARSVDGRSWQFLDVRGLPGGVVIEQIDQIDSTLVALGRDGLGRVHAYWASLPA